MFYLLTEKVQDGTVYANETLFASAADVAAHMFDAFVCMPHHVIAVDPVAGTSKRVEDEVAAAISELSFQRESEPRSTVSSWAYMNGADCWSDEEVYAAGRRAYRDSEASRIAHRNAVY